MESNYVINESIKKLLGYFFALIFWFSLEYEIYFMIRINARIAFPRIHADTVEYASNAPCRI